MAAPIINPLPPAPLTTDSGDVFDSKAFVFVGALDTFRDQTQQVADWTKARTDEVSSLRDQAEILAGLAQDAADTAINAGILYQDVTEGLANTAEGGFFSIPSASTTGYTDLYQKVSGAAVYQKTSPSRELLDGAIQDVSALFQDTAELSQRFDDLTLDYAPGIELTGYQQILRDTSGEFWRESGSTDLPYTTTGAGLPEGGAFVAVGDAVLRQELNSNTPAQGSDLIAHTGTSDTVTEALNNRVIRVSSRTEMKAYDVPAAGYQFSLEEGGRSGLFVVKTGAAPSDPEEGIYVVLANGNYAERVINGPWTPFWFGAVGGGADDTAAVLGMADLAPAGADIVLPVDLVVSDTVATKDFQVWGFGGWLKLRDGGVVVNSIFNVSLRKGVTLINPLIDGDAANNTDSGGSGQQSALTAYSVDSLIVFGGHIKNAMHNSVQGSRNNALFIGTKFELTGEHLVYLSSGIDGPSAPVQSGFVFDSCHFINPYRDTAAHSEGHFIQCRGLTDVSIIGKTIMEKDINEDASFCALFTNCKDIDISGVTCSGMTSAALYSDQYCENIQVNKTNFYRPTTAGYETSRNFSDKPIVFNDCYFERPAIQPSSGVHLFNDCRFLMGGDFRSTRPLEFNNCRFRLKSDYSLSIIFQARDDKLSMRNCRISVGAETPALGVSTFAGGAGWLDIDGLVFEDWPNAASAVRVLEGTASYQSIKGIELPDYVTDPYAIWIRDNAGIVRLAELNCVGTTPTISATGVTAIEYGNITSST